MMFLQVNLKCKLNLHLMKSKLYYQREWMFVTIQHLQKHLLRKRTQTKLLRKCKNKMRPIISKTLVKLSL